MEDVESGADFSWLNGKVLKSKHDNDYTNAEWVRDYSVYIKMILSKIILNLDRKNYTEKKKDEILALIVNSTTIKYFIYAVTHDSFQVEPQKNYQTYEMIGDKLLGFSFSFYMRKRFKDVSPSDITNFVKKILSTEYQAKISDGLGLSNWVIMYQPGNNKKLLPNAKVREDLGEAFFGVLSVIIDKLKYPEDGKESIYIDLFDILNSFLKLMFDKREFNFEVPGIDDKSYVEQRFQRTIGNIKTGGLNIDHKEYEEDNKKYWIVKVYVTDKNKQRLKDEFNIRIGENVLGFGKNKLKKQAEKIAFEKAREYLEEIGFNDEAIDKVKKKIDDSLKDQVIKKARNEVNKNIIDTKFSIYSNDSYALYQLIGVRKDNIKKILYTKMFDNTATKTNKQKEEETLKEYIES